MPDEKVAAAIESAEKGETESAPLAEEVIEDTTEEKVATDTATEEPTVEKKTVDETTDEKKVEGEIDAILAEDETGDTAQKTGEQKRIDKLTAKLYAAEEKISKLEAAKEGKPESEPKYTEEQLKKAHAKAISDGDADLAWEINQYQLKQVRKELRDEYLGEQKKVQETQARIGKEWNETVQTYGYLSEPKEKEIYPGSRRELNLADQQSLLYQVALRLFNSQDPEKWQIYHSPGGQKLAVADALQYLLKKRRGMLTSRDEVKGVERKLAKEKRKSSLGSGESLKDESIPPKKYASDKERLDDYIAERLKYRSDRTGANF